jgi:hypothetical protein
MNRDTQSYKGGAFIPPPDISKDLINYLDQIYNGHVSTLPKDITDRDLGVVIGQCEVVQHLRALYEDQQQEQENRYSNVL